MKPRLKITLLLLGFYLGGVAITAQTARYALVIGNGSYDSLEKLRNPVNDATDMSAKLKQLGFQVDTLIDADLPSMEDAAIRLGAELSSSKDAIGFFFYSGHGVQSNGINYLIPVDAHIPAEPYLKTKALAVPEVLDTLQEAHNSLNVVILDACRDNPFSWSRSGTRGLTVVGAQPAGSIVVYATGAGSVAQDGQGRNGLFTSQLLKHLGEPGLDIKEVFNKTGNDVAEASNGVQIPAIYSQFFKAVYLNGTPAPPAGASTSDQAKKPKDTAAHNLDWYQSEALQGNSEAQFQLAGIYEEGKGVAKDLTQAAAWYRKAANQGNADAETSLGLMLERGLGLDQDWKEAADWYRKAAEQGSVIAEAQLGSMYEKGLGVEQDFTLAAAWCQKAASQNNAQAQSVLGLLYENGWGVDKDPSLALSWYRKAADQGNADAESGLALIYENALGVERDYSQAFSWYLKAANQGNADALNNLGLMYENGWGVDQDFSLAYAWYQKAAEQGNAIAQKNLGLMYEKGRGVEEDFAKAASWYRKSAEQGNVIAQIRLKILEDSGKIK